MKFLRISLFILLVFSLFSCVASSPEPESMMLTNVYAATPVSAPEMDVDGKYRVSCTSDGFALFDVLSGSLSYRFDRSGSHLETVPIPSLPREDLSFAQVFLLRDGNLLGYALDRATKTYTLLLFSREGSLLREIALEEADYSALLGVSDTEIVWIQNTDVTVLARDFSVLHRFSLSFFPKDIRVVDDTVYLLANDALYILDTETGTCTDLSPRLGHSYTAAYPGPDYAYYRCDMDGIWGVADADETLLCSFAHSFLSAADIEELYVLSADAFLARYRDPVQKTGRWTLLLPSDERVEKRPVRIALVSAFPEPDYHTLCNAFNQSGTTYFARLTDYSSGNTEMRYTYAAERFQMDLLSGESYDLYFFSGYADTQLRQTLYANGSLADISAVYTDNLLPAIRKAYLETNGAAYSVPYRMGYTFLAAGKERDGSLQTMRALLDGGKSLAGVDIGGVMSRVFCDGLIEERECAFTSPAYLAFLEFLRLQNEHCTKEYGFTSNVRYPEGHMAFCFSDKDLIAALRNDKIAYLRMNISQPWMTAIAKEIFGTSNPLGFPTLDGGSAAYAHPEGTMSIPKTAQETMGAMAFLRFYLSDATQSLLSASALPLTESALKKATAARYYYLERNEKSQNQRCEYRKYAAYEERPANPPSETLKNIFEVTLTDEEVEAFRDLIRNASISSGRDNMVMQIVEEEIEPFFAGDRTAQTTADIIQKRASVYLAE